MKDERSTTLAELINKKSGVKAFTGANLELSSTIKFGIPSGIPMLDLSLGRPGLPAGRIIEVYGKEHCLDKNSFIRYEVRTKSGRPQNVKGGTIENLWHRFHKVQREGSGHYRRSASDGSVFYAPCMAPDNSIVMGRIMDVVNTGQKPCFIVKTVKGKELVSTEDHEYATVDGFSPLKNLSVGSKIFTYQKRTKAKKTYKPRPCVCVKQHPTAPTKIVDKKYLYKRIPLSHLYYEAYKNNMNVDSYRQRLNDMSQGVDDIWTVPKDMQIHHIDENHDNNSISNLQLLTAKEHSRLHALDRLLNLASLAQEDEISSIEEAGIRDTYDIKMMGPHHNFIANHFVVHNCGKTSLSYAAIKEAQQMGGQAVFIDTERSFMEERAVDCGVDTNNLIITEADTVEEIFKVIEATLDGAGEATQLNPLVIVVDSITGVPCKSTIEKDIDEEPRVGEAARVIRRGITRLNKKLAKNHALVIFINHAYHKISAMAFGKQTESAGGMALKFYGAVRLELAALSNLNKGDGDDRTREGMISSIKVEKNKIAKTGNPQVKAELTETGFDLYAGLWDGFKKIEALEPINKQVYYFRPSEAQVSKRDWKSFVDSQDGGVRGMYMFFLKAAIKNGYIKDYTLPGA